MTQKKPGFPENSKSQQQQTPDNLTQEILFECTPEALQLDNQICFALYSASNAITRTYRPLLDPLGLTYLQYIVMMVLWQEDNISVKSLGEKVRLDSGTLTPLLKRLEAKELLIRGRSPDDERVRVLTLTDTGRELKQQATIIPQQMLCQVQLLPEDLKRLKSLCDRLLNNLSD